MGTAFSQEGFVCPRHSRRDHGHRMVRLTPGSLRKDAGYRAEIAPAEATGSRQQAGEGPGV